MSQQPNYERALQRERKARTKAEALLEDKTRELFISNQQLKNQNNNLHEKNKELNLLFTIAELGEQNSSTHDFLQQFINLLCKIYHYPVAHVYLVDNDKEEKILRTSDIYFLSNTEKHQIFIDNTQKTFFKIDEGFPGKVYKKNEAFYLENVFAEINSPRSQVGKSIGLQHALGIPILRYNETIAIAEFFCENEKINFSSPEEILTIFKTATKQLSTLLERRSSEQELRENYEKLKNMQAQLLQSSKMASIGQLAAGVAHEINNPLAFINTNFSALKKYMVNITEILDAYEKLLGQPENKDLQNKVSVLIKKSNLAFILSDLTELLDDSTDGMKRIIDIIADLKSFSRVDEAEIKEVDINDCLKSTIKMVSNEIKYKCALNLELAELPTIACYPGQLNQVFMNLLVNAGHAIEERGEINISTQKDPENITIKISDTGSGIADEHLEKLFDPFFTTKPIGTGTGLGLSISYGIIQKHGGKINVASELGQGTTFEISLPLHGVSTNS